MKLYSVILILYSNLFCVHVQAMDYYFSNFCYVYSGIPRTKTIYPSRSGSSKNGSIRASTILYSTGLNCTLQLNPPAGSDGIALTVVEVDLRQKGSACLDTITIQRSKYSSGPWYTVMSDTCYSVVKEDYSNDGPMRIIFRTSSATSYTTYRRGFNIVYSIYMYQDHKSRIATIVGGAAGGFVFLIIVIGIAILIRRKRLLIVRSTTTMASPQTTLVFPQQMIYPNPPPPPYGDSQQQTNYTYSTRPLP